MAQALSDIKQNVKDMTGALTLADLLAIDNVSHVADPTSLSTADFIHNLMDDTPAEFAPALRVAAPFVL